MGFPNYCLAFMIIALSLKARIITSQNITCNIDDLKALKVFQNCVESGIEGWNNSASLDCCNWRGVTCSALPSIGKRIVGLELGNMRLTGEICESFSGLDQLKILNLSHNNFSGSLPDEFFHFHNLEVLDLSNNNLASTFASICEVSTSLRVLDLSNNHFYGEIPKSLGNCTSLQILSLHGNDLSGNFPESVFKLHNLSELKLAGSLPDIFKRLGKLEYLIAESNNFTGQLPASLTNSPSLLVLNMNNNSLDGQINLNCSAMVKLMSLDLGSNSFQGPLPKSLSTCRRLVSVNLSHNKFNSEVPHSYKNLQALSFFSVSNAGIRNLSAALVTLQHCKNLSVLVLTMNFHEEEMPSEVDLRLNNIKSFVLANSQLKGRIPKWLSGCNKLQLLDLSWNNLQGTVPSWFGKLEFLFYLDLSNNSLSSEIPESLTGLWCLDQEYFFSEEPIPSFPFYSCHQGTTGLKYNKLQNLRPSLDLSNNNLTGPIWPTFGNMKMLHVLDLRKNGLSGIIPSSLSGMKNLEILDLSQNKLSGSIPYSLLGLHFLSHFDVSFNMLSGQIPSGGQFDTFPFSSFEGNKGLWGFNFPSSDPVLEQTTSLAPNNNDQTGDFGWAFGLGTATGFVLSVYSCFMSGWVFPEAGRKEESRIGIRGRR
ncbi:Phytosulfokine receptor 1 [Morus notabilis]|uniref:Phytosulfokine receptor 1 n=1 Tax=Morus notabilis TaxID=981085 RepID=W9RZH1_9ROSA|nr:phytosulfokine receptor 1 [Morus notabilis]EXC19407.1 Phytosulfokine receptor 1 [Morus notabilis]